MAVSYECAAGPLEGAWRTAGAVVGAGGRIWVSRRRREGSGELGELVESVIPAPSRTWLTLGYYELAPDINPRRATHGDERGRDPLRLRWQWTSRTEWPAHVPAPPAGGAGAAYLFGAGDGPEV